MSITYDDMMDGSMMCKKDEDKLEHCVHCGGYYNPKDMRYVDNPEYIWCGIDESEHDKWKDVK